MPTLSRYAHPVPLQVHHDQNTATWTPQGPRILTFFMYLNTPGGGGGTRFPQVGRSADAPDGIVVSPVKGSAVIWPSVYDDRPLEADQRTSHEAMPVRARDRAKRRDGNGTTATR